MVILPFAPSLHNAAMTAPIHDTRRSNLRALIGIPPKHGDTARFARKHDLDPNYLSQLLNGHRNMGEKAARELEQKVGLAPMTLDSVDHGAVREPAGRYMTEIKQVVDHMDEADIQAWLQIGKRLTGKKPEQE